MTIRKPDGPVFECSLYISMKISFEIRALYNGWKLIEYQVYQKKLKRMVWSVVSKISDKECCDPLKT